MAEPAWTSDDLPLLGEVFAVELANTRYDTDQEDVDFLDGADGAATWFGLAPAAAGLVVPEPLPVDALAAIRRVRDATRAMLEATAAETRTVAGDRAAEVLAVEARRAPGYLALGIGDDGAPTWRLQHEGAAPDVLVAAVAGRCILFLGSADAGQVRRCEHPDCPMFFVRRHRSRRFCHESCAHSVRQARYYRSVVRARRAGSDPQRSG